MIRYSSAGMDEIDRYFDKLSSASSDVMGYVHYLLEEIMVDDEFAMYFPAEEITEELTRLRTEAQILNERIEDLANVHKNIYQDIKELEKRQISRLGKFKSRLDLAKAQFEGSYQWMKGSSTSLSIEMDEASCLYRMISGKKNQGNRSSLGAIRHILKNQYRYQKVKPYEMDI